APNIVRAHGQASFRAYPRREIRLCGMALQQHMPDLAEALQGRRAAVSNIVWQVSCPMPEKDATKRNLRVRIDGARPAFGHRFEPSLVRDRFGVIVGA